MAKKKVKCSVSVEEVKAIAYRRDAINSIPLSKLEIYENGKKVKITKETRQAWDYTGLSNIDFITSGSYKEKTLWHELKGF